MPNVTFSEDDLSGRKQVIAGWCKMRVMTITEARGKKDPESTTWPATLKIEESQSTSNIGMIIRHWFSEKKMGRLADFVSCFTSNGSLSSGKSYTLEETIDKLVMGYVDHDISTGYNVIKDFKPVGK